MVETKSHRLKFDRACKHLDILERAQRGEEPDAYVVTYEADPNGGSHQVKLKEVNEGFLGCVIGDCAHNFRCALDHLVLELAADFTPNLPPTYEESCSFPIFGPYPMPADKEQQLLGPLDPRAIAKIKALQPHNRGTQYLDDPLWKLHELDRIDKHRRLHVVSSKVAGLGVGGRNVSVEVVKFSGVGGKMKGGTVLGTFAASPFDPGRKMNVQLRTRSEIAFDQGTLFPGELVVPLLKEVREYIKDHVIAPLVTYFK